MVIMLIPILFILIPEFLNILKPFLNLPLTLSNPEFPSFPNISKHYTPKFLSILKHF